VKARLFNLLAGLSLLLSMTMAVLWMRSHRCIDAISWTGDYKGAEATSIDGSVGLAFLEATHNPPPGYRVRCGFVRTDDGQRFASGYSFADAPGWSSAFGLSLSFQPPISSDSSDQVWTTATITVFHATSIWNKMGFSTGPQGASVGGVALTSGRSIFIPDWFFCMAFALMPLVSILRIRKNARRVRNGLCATCGYDLRASPDRCPECGTVPKEIPISI